MGYRKIWITIPASRAWAQGPGWPCQITKPQGTLDYYQPQVDSNFQELDWRMAITITPPGWQRDRRSGEGPWPDEREPTEPAPGT
jgi:hypothetical protein